ncbi:MAG: hypothetical protein VB042_08585 [Victivallaceae bacterium]|nr:hypothetical protein [Victivallaceae bacterium]
MNTRKTLKEALVGCDRGKAAEAAGITLGSLNNQVSGELPYFPKGTTPNFLDRVYNFVDLVFSETGKVVVLEKLAEEFGFMLIANPVIRATDCPALGRIAQIMRDFASTIDEMGKAVEDGVIDKDEAAGIRARWEIVKRQTEEFVLACETGAYSRKLTK